MVSFNCRQALFLFLIVLTALFVLELVTNVIWPLPPTINDHSFLVVTSYAMMYGWSTFWIIRWKRQGRIRPTGIALLIVAVIFMTTYVLTPRVLENVFRSLAY